MMATLSMRRDEIDPAYLAQISREPHMTVDEAASLAYRVAEGDLEARDELVRRNLRLVIKVARRELRRGLSLMDLVSEGNIGLIRAAEEFNPDLGLFSTYATFRIRAAIQHKAPAMTRGIGLKRHAVKTLRNRGGAHGKLEQELGRRPTEHEIDEYLALSPVSRAYARDITRAHATKGSSDLSGHDGEGFDFNQIPGKELKAIDARLEITEALRVASDSLTDDEIKVINARHPRDGDQPTYMSIGKALGFSHTWVIKTETRALAKLREAFQASGFDPGAKGSMGA
jgi:RNA polymerase primary sigma factor